MNSFLSRRGAFAIAASAMALAVAPTALAQNGDPVAIIRGVLDAYARDSVPKPPYTPAIQNRLKREEIGADIILDAQDTDIKDIQVRGLSQGPDRAVVEARFTSFDRKMRLEFDFRIVDGKWMIANLRRLAGSDPFDMRKWLKLPPLT